MEEASQGENPEIDLFWTLTSAFPEVKLDTSEPARKAWNRLSREERALATRFAPAYVAAARAAGHRLMHRAGYLRAKAWEKFALEAERDSAARTAQASRVPPPEALTPFGRRFRARLEAMLDENVFACWFSEMTAPPPTYGIATVSVSTPFRKRFIEQNYNRHLLAAARSVDPDIVEVCVKTLSGAGPSGHVAGPVSAL